MGEWKLWVVARILESAMVGVWLASLGLLNDGELSLPRTISAVLEVDPRQYLRSQHVNASAPLHSLCVLPTPLSYASRQYQIQETPMPLPYT